MCWSCGHKTKELVYAQKGHYVQSISVVNSCIKHELYKNKKSVHFTKICSRFHKLLSFHKKKTIDGRWLLKVWLGIIKQHFIVIFVATTDSVSGFYRLKFWNKKKVFASRRQYFSKMLNDNSICITRLSDRFSVASLTFWK